MLRSVLVALDGSSSSQRAAQFSLELARRYCAHISGFVVSETASIQSPEPVLGASAALDLSRLSSPTERIHAITREFLREAGDRGITTIDARAVEVSPVACIVREAAAFDLIALGRESLVDVGGELCALPLCVERIIRLQPRPVLLIPGGAGGSADAALGGPVLVAFDGSPAASRTVHMFALLGLARDRRVHVMTVNEASEAEAAETAGFACQLLSRHGAADVHPIALCDSQAGSPSETILGLAKGLDATMVVMGAYGHRGMRELFGSCTAEVVRECPKPLLLYH